MKLESKNIEQPLNPQLNIGAVVCSCLSEEFVDGFTSDGELTPIDIVSEITGLTYDEIRSCSKIVRVP
jgi:hypothetical protein